MLPNMPPVQAEQQLVSVDPLYRWPDEVWSTEEWQQWHAERRWDWQTPPVSPETLLRRLMMPEGTVAKKVRFVDLVDSSVERASDDPEGSVDETIIFNGHEDTSYEDAVDNPAPEYCDDEYGQDCKSQ